MKLMWQSASNEELTLANSWLREERQEKAKNWQREEREEKAKNWLREEREEEGFVNT